MYFIDEQHIIRLQIGQNGSEIAGTFKYRAGGMQNAHIKLIGNDVGQGGFSQSGGAKNKYMIQRFLAHIGSRYKEFHLLGHGLLSMVLGKRLGTHCSLLSVFVPGHRRNQPVFCFDAHSISKVKITITTPLLQFTGTAQCRAYQFFNSLSIAGTLVEQAFGLSWLVTE